MSDTKKNKQPKVILESKAHFSFFLYPTILLIIGLYYTFSNLKSNYFILIGMLLFIGLQYYFNYYGKKLVLTDKKIYIFSRNKKKISWSLVDDLEYVSYQQNKLNKLFNSGSLILINNNKEMYTYNYLPNIVDIYEKILLTYDIEMKRLDPNHEMVFTNQNNVVDSIDEN